MNELLRKALESRAILQKKKWLDPKPKWKRPEDAPSDDWAASWRMAWQRENGFKPDPSYEPNGQMRLLTRGMREVRGAIKYRLRELAARSVRLVELSMVTAAQIAKVGNPVDRKAVVKSFRRWLEKQGDRMSVRSAMGANPGKYEITTRKQAERMTKDAYMRRAAAKHKDIFPDGDTWPEISFNDPDFAIKHKKLKRIERIAERAAKSARYQRATGNAPGYVKKGMPKLVKVDGDLSLLTYRGIERQPIQLQPGSVPERAVIADATRKLRRPRQGWEPVDMSSRRAQGSKTPRQVRHSRRAVGGIQNQIGDPNGTAMSMSTSPRVARDFAEGGPVGAYTVRLKDLIKEARDQKLRGAGNAKFAMTNSIFRHEREITQANGGNLAAVRVNEATGARRRLR